MYVKAVVKHRDDPNGPTYVYKLEQSDEQDSVTSLSDVMGGKDKMTYDHCSIFIDNEDSKVHKGCYDEDLCSKCKKKGMCCIDVCGIFYCDKSSPC